MKLGGWLVMLTGMMLFLTFIGLPTIFSSTLSQIGITTNSTSALPANIDIESSNFWGELFGSSGTFLVILAGGAVVIGLFARGYDPSLIILAPLIFVAGTFIPTFIILIKYMATFNQSWMTSIAYLLFGSLSVGFIWACVDYFRTGT